MSIITTTINNLQISWHFNWKESQINLSQVNY